MHLAALFLAHVNARLNKQASTCNGAMYRYAQLASLARVNTCYACEFDKKLAHVDADVQDVQLFEPVGVSIGRFLRRREGGGGVRKPGEHNMGNIVIRTRYIYQLYGVI